MRLDTVVFTSQLICSLELIYLHMELNILSGWAKMEDSVFKYNINSYDTSGSRVQTKADFSVSAKNKMGHNFVRLA
jgi:hypothetical protein